MGHCLGCSSPPPPNVADATGIWARRHSVANTAKRAIIIVGCAIAFGESMSMPKMVGCGIAIGGTFFYAIIDDLVKPKAKKA